jgi:acetyl esterase/lipase
MKFEFKIHRGLFALVATLISLQSPAAAPIPDRAPRTMVLSGKHEAFRAYCTDGEGAKAFAKIKADFDKDYLVLPFPDEPKTYGDPEPKKRDSAKADKWRATQDTCGRISAVAEAAALIWVVTKEEKYFAKAKEFLLKSSTWHFAPDWKSGDVAGATDIYYNDEAHFRLWRKMPLVYDQLRAKLTPEEKKIVLAHFQERGSRSEQWIKKSDIEKIKRNSLEIDAESHPVRFMAMTGLSGLALWDDLPEAREWWRLAYVFYRDQFSPWGGDDGGWAEGPAYWRGTFEHAAFQDALLAIGDPLAYSTEFWKNSPYFALYNVQPYLHTIFGDTSNAGRFNLDPNIADYMEHVARVQQNGFFRAYAELCTDKRPRPVDKGLDSLDRTYPTACEFLVRNFIASGKPLPHARPLSDLPSQRFFRDVGWVSLHSALGKPDEDIHITFKSSPYGSFSHSHADQNAFILNAFGEGLAINSAYREFHRSPHHQQWTWQTKSKNALLIDGAGQKAQDKKATGKITRYEVSDRAVWTTGDATVAYATGQQNTARIQRATRDLIFVDKRYVVLRDRVTLKSPGKISWLLHAEKELKWDEAADRALIRSAEGKATLVAQLIAPGTKWHGTVTDEFSVPVDAKYTSGQVTGSYLTAKWTPQQHLTVESAEMAKDFTVFAVLWPDRGMPEKLVVSLRNDSALEIRRPDGGRDVIKIEDKKFELSSAGNTTATIMNSVGESASAKPSEAKSAEVERTPESLPSAQTFVYREGKPEPMRLHVFKPKGWKASDRRPVLMFFFGGGWTRGTPEKSAAWANYAAKIGMIGMAPDYRTKDRFNTSPLESVADGRAALRWVQDHAGELGIDAKKITVGGSSAGGHVALWTAIAKTPPGSDPDESPRMKPAAVILLSAVSDTSVLSGYTPKRFGTNATLLSPIHQLDPTMPPVLAFHGDADKTVPLQQTLALRDKLVAAGNQCEFVSVPGGEHSFTSQLPEWKEKSRAAIKEFLTRRHLVAAEDGQSR